MADLLILPVLAARCAFKVCPAPVSPSVRARATGEGRRVVAQTCSWVNHAYRALALSLTLPTTINNGQKLPWPGARGEFLPTILACSRPPCACAAGVRCWDCAPVVGESRSHRLAPLSAAKNLRNDADFDVASVCCRVHRRVDSGLRGEIFHVLPAV